MNIQPSNDAMFSNDVQTWEEWMIPDWLMLVCTTVFLVWITWEAIHG